MRYPKREVQAMFIRFIKKLCPTSETQADYFLDYASCYGGYVIEKYRPGEGVSFPFGMARKSGKEMYYALSMACDVLDELDQTMCNDYVREKA
jgi:hypothetical protein